MDSAFMVLTTDLSSASWHQHRTFTHIDVFVCRTVIHT